MSPLHGANLVKLANYFAQQILTSETEGSRVYEPVIALVTDNKDPDKLGRVKVKIPILSDSDTTDWTPIVMFGASKNRGWFFIPEIDDEVLVMFEHGDMQRPLVVGALWNGQDKPPDNNSDGKNDRRVIKSRAGSRFLFDDSDSPQVVIEDGGGKGRITLDAQNNKIIIEALDGDVCFQAPSGKIQIVAKSIDITATQNLQIHAASNIQVGSSASIKITQQADTFSGSQVNANCGNALAPQAPSADPKDVDDPYGS
jgi:uncharacterized protein involved in type VI secretion and phage assembly